VLTEAPPTGERYLGRASGPSITYLRRGFALYATDCRLFGVKERNLGEIGAMFNRPQPTQKTIPELESKHDFVLWKDEISQLELTKAGVLAMGHLLIRRKSGRPIKVRFREADFEKVRDLMKSFFPEAVKMAKGGHASG